MKLIKKLLIALLIGITIYLFVQYDQSVTDISPVQSAGDNKSILNAVQKRLKDVQVSGMGRVSRILPDDNYGDRHQRFILRLDNEHTVLIAHNIDLAKRISKLRRGDIVRFYGEYEWNPKGGVVHWTHHDPKGYHKDGWLKHSGKIYK